MHKITLVNQMYESNWNRTSHTSHVSRVISSIALGTDNFVNEVMSEKDNGYNSRFLELAKAYLNEYPSADDISDIAEGFMAKASLDPDYHVGNVKKLLAAQMPRAIHEFDSDFRGDILEIIRVKGYTIIETTKSFYVDGKFTYSFGSFESAMLYAICPQYHDAMCKLAGVK